MTKPDYVRSKPLVTLARDKTLYFTGETFDQWDLDILIHCVAKTTLAGGDGEQIQLDAAELLHAMNCRNVEQNRQRIFESLLRLHCGDLMIKGKGYHYMTRLIDRVLLDEQGGRCLVEVNDDVASSLRGNSDLGLDIRDRMTFGRNDLAKWLHGATMVFKGGFSADLDCLHTICGAHSRTKGRFPDVLGKALAAMEEIGLLGSWSLDASKVVVAPRHARKKDCACGFMHTSTVR